MSGYTRHPASYKDPSGFVFQTNGKIYRQVNKVYAENYDHFIGSGLYEVLTGKHYLLSHTEIKDNITSGEEWYTTLLPEQLSFTSYPYEWCFEQMKDAALLTLEIVKIAVGKGMILKDATPFNIQFHKGNPVFIDTLSFEKYDASLPWIAYRQFCETFLFPLWLAHYHKTSFQHLLGVYPGGIPVEIAAKLLPGKSGLNPGVWLHVRLQNKLNKSKLSNKSAHHFTKNKLLNLVSHLESIIQKLDNSNKTNWSSYYTESINSPEYLHEKEKIISELLSDVHVNKVLDLGANEGQFSLLAAEKGVDVVAIDNDEQCINNFYKKVKKLNIAGILPLCIDIINPSPASGFDNRERTAFSERIQPDIVMALALIHHLVIGKNIPLSMVAEYLSRLAPQLIIEFVPKEDEKTQLLLQNKKDIYTEYSKEGFESCFGLYFNFNTAKQVGDTGRFIYMMNKK